MDAILGLGLLWALLGCRGGGGGSSAPAQPAMPGGEPGWPGSPISVPTSTPPWPQVVPETLPSFPGPGWEFDEPPPPAVQERARALLSTLWARGSGASKIEQTAGRWIAYQAQVVASGKKGVVAYRERKAAAPAAPAGGGVTASRAAPRPTAAPPARPAARPTAARPAPPRVTTTQAPPRATPAPAAPASSSTRAAPASVVALPVLRRGAGIKPKPPSNDVKLLQQRLGIAADGQFGSGTDAAVRTFQARNGLQVDGIVGEKTWAALFAGARA